MASTLHLVARRRFDASTTATTRRVLSVPSGDLEPWLADVIPMVLDGQRSVVASTDAYLSLDAGLATGTDQAPWGIDAERIIGARARHGVPLEDVYARTVRSGADVAQRLTREVATDMQLARREASAIHTVGDPRIVGYKRILGRGGRKGPCPLCVVASGRTYKSEDLLPIHSHCTCSVQPVYMQAPAPNVDGAFLDDLYDRSGEYGGPDILHIDADELPEGMTVTAARVTTSPELGPTLVAA